MDDLQRMATVNSRLACRLGLPHLWTPPCQAHLDGTCGGALIDVAVAVFCAGARGVGLQRSPLSCCAVARPGGIRQQQRCAKDAALAPEARSCSDSTGLQHTACAQAYVLPLVQYAGWMIKCAVWCTDCAGPARLPPRQPPAWQWASAR